MVEKLYDAAEKYNADIVLAGHYEVYDDEIKKVQVLPKSSDAYLFNMNAVSDRYRFQSAGVIRKTKTAWNNF